MHKQKQAVDQLMLADIPYQDIVRAFSLFPLSVVHYVAYKAIVLTKLPTDKKVAKFWQMLATHRLVKNDKPEPLNDELINLIRPKPVLPVAAPVPVNVVQQQADKELIEEVEFILQAHEEWRKSNLDVGRAGIAKMRAALSSK